MTPGAPETGRVDTPIGAGLAPGSASGRLAAVVALAATVVDLQLARGGYSWARASVPGAVLLVYAWLWRGRRLALGLRLTPIQGLGTWVLWTAWLAAGLLAVAAILCGLFALCGVTFEAPALAPRDAARFALNSLVLAPVVEEAVYRFALCVPLVPLLGVPWTCVVSGAAFVLLHVVYGNLAPNHLLAGVALAWVFLCSGSLLLSIVLHSLGNVCAMGLSLLVWWWRSV
jgi:membrane protease YdiL (CAAX protease family)